MTQAVIHHIPTRPPHTRHLVGRTAGNAQIHLVNRESVSFFILTLRSKERSLQRYVSVIYVRVVDIIHPDPLVMFQKSDNLIMAYRQYPQIRSVISSGMRAALTCIPIATVNDSTNTVVTHIHGTPSGPLQCFGSESIVIYPIIGAHRALRIYPLPSND